MKRPTVLGFAQQAHAPVPAAAKPSPPGSPGPVGLFGFGMTTCSLMFVDAAWAEPAFKDAVMGFALAYGGLTQWVAGLLELFKGNTFAGTAFMSFGAFWVGWWYTGVMYKQGHFFGASEYQTGEALLLAQWGLFTLALFVLTLHRRFPLKLKVVFGSLAATFFLLAGGQFSDGCKRAAGYIGFACGMSANFAAFTEVMAEAWGATAETSNAAVVEILPCDRAAGREGALPGPVQPMPGGTHGDLEAGSPVARPPDLPPRATPADMHAGTCHIITGASRKTYQRMFSGRATDLG